MIIRAYHDLKVWHKAMDLAKMCHTLTKTFPKDEMYGMTSQLRRAASSIPANIAEGQGRQGTKEFLNFLSIARGSLYEVETHLQLSHRYDYLTEEQIQPLLAVADEISRMLSGLRTQLLKRL